MKTVLPVLHWKTEAGSTAGRFFPIRWFDGGEIFPDQEMFDIGIPCAYDGKDAPVYVLNRTVALVLRDKSIQDILSRGLYTDGPTLDLLNERGFGELTGFKTFRRDPMDRMTEFVDHPLNGAFASRRCDNRQSFPKWHYPAYLLEKTAPQAQSLARLLDYSFESVHDCGMGVFENKLGGRICVQGYYPWTFLQNLSRSWQLKSVMRWLSKDTLPGYIASYHKINLWIRQPQNRKIVLAFTNASFDPAENVILLLRTGNKTIKLYDMDCHQLVIQSNESDGPYRKFIIPYVDPWHIRLLVTES
jgi:hypothetical protein